MLGNVVRRVSMSSPSKGRSLAPKPWTSSPTGSGTKKCRSGSRGPIGRIQRRRTTNRTRGLCWCPARGSQRNRVQGQCSYGRQAQHRHRLGGGGISPYADALVAGVVLYQRLVGEGGLFPDYHAPARLEPKPLIETPNVFVADQIDCADRLQLCHGWISTGLYYLLTNEAYAGVFMAVAQ